MMQPLLAPGFDEKSGYVESDDLIHDLNGDNGEARRSVARGYVTAVRDADADYLDGHALLRQLRGEGGEALRLAGQGYVMAMRDGMASRTGDGSAPSVPARARMQADAEHVERWLRRHRSARDGLACSLVRSALRVAPAAPPRLVFGWRRGLLVTAVAAALLCIGPMLASHGPGLSRVEAGRSLGHDIELSRQAAEITRLLLEERRYEKDLFINIANREQSASYAKRWDETHAALVDAIARTRTLALQEADRRAMHEIESDLQSYAFGYQRVLSGIRGGQIRTAEEANQELAVYKSAVHRIESNGSAIAARADERLGKLT